MAFFSGYLRWLWRILANSLRIVGGLLRPLDSLDHAIDIGDLGGFDRAIDNAFAQAYADPLWGLVFFVKLLVKFIWLDAGSCAYSCEFCAYLHWTV